MQSSATDISSSFLVVGLIFIILFYGVFFILYLLPFIINLYILFIKAKKNGWSAFVPIWSNFTYGVISKRSKNIVWIYIFVLTIYYTLVVLNNVIGFSALSGSAFSLIVDSFSRIVFFVSIVLGLYIFIGFIKQYKINQIPSLLYWFLFIFIPIVALFWTSKAQHIGEDGILSQNNNASGVPAQVNAQVVGFNQPNIAPINPSTTINSDNVAGFQQNSATPAAATYSQPSNVGYPINNVSLPPSQTTPAGSEDIVQTTKQPVVLQAQAPQQANDSSQQNNS